MPALFQRPHLGQPLEDYIKLLPKVKLLRQPERLGLVKARLRGAEACQAETFTVLDSHIEVQTGWLEPLMRRMKDHPERVMMHVATPRHPPPPSPRCTLAHTIAAPSRGGTRGCVLSVFYADLPRKLRAVVCDDDDYVARHLLSPSGQ